MKLRLGLLMSALLWGWPVRCEIRDVMKSAEIDALFAKTQTSTDVEVKPNYIISLRVQSRPGSWVTHFDEDEIWLVRHGSAKLSLGSATLGAGVRRSADNIYDVGAGDVVNIPRAMAYQLLPGARFEYIAVQIFPTERHTPTGTSSADQPMPYVVPNATIQETFAKSTSNQPLHRLGAAGMNHVIYMGAPGPYEVHLGCDDIYFVRLGNAVAQVDGHLLNPTEGSPGEIRGTGAFGFREHKIGVGDIVLIPRNTMHHMDPGPEKLGYLLLKVYQ
jgi:mannose-6-phosphate isomerase-like protein (cupin superfamily)